MLLVRRFRGSVKGRVWYAGPLLRLLDVPGLKRLGQRLVRAVERAERGGLGLAEAFRELDTHRTGEIRFGSSTTKRPRCLRQQPRVCTYRTTATSTARTHQYQHESSAARPVLPALATTFALAVHRLSSVA